MPTKAQPTEQFVPREDIPKIEFDLSYLLAQSENYGSSPVGSGAWRLLAHIIQELSYGDRFNKTADRALSNADQALADNHVSSQGEVSTSMKTAVPVSSTEPDRVIEWYTGILERVDEDVAFVSLIDGQGQKYEAEFDSSLFVDTRISQGGRFFCIIKEGIGEEDEPQVVILPRIRHPLTDDEWRDIEARCEALFEGFQEDDNECGIQ